MKREPGIRIYVKVDIGKSVAVGVRDAMRREPDQLKGVADVEGWPMSQSGCRDGSNDDSAITLLLRRSEGDRTNFSLTCSFGRRQFRNQTQRNGQAFELEVRAKVELGSVISRIARNFLDHNFRRCQRILGFHGLGSSFARNAILLNPVV